MKKAVLIGAGQTGRGFIAPIVEDNGYRIIFLDKDPELVAQLNREGSYVVRYFGNEKEPREIGNYKAYDINTEEAVQEIAASDVVFVSVFASHIGELKDVFQKAVKQRKKGKLTIFCCENGVNVKQPLAELPAVISEGIIFCTTLKPEKEKLYLISQNYPELPVDGKVEGLQVYLEGMPHEQDFPSLIQRKIYTYNFISAVVAYLGSYKNYEVYGEAANDADIAGVIGRIAPIISDVIAKEYQIPEETQALFTKRAVDKFQNREIYDTIYRNARQAGRKLGEKERLMTPLRLAVKWGADTSVIELVIAAALYFGSTQEELEAGPVLKQAEEITGSAERVKKLYEMFCAGKPLKDILETVV